MEDGGGASQPRAGRCLTVWGVVTATAALGLALALPPAVRVVEHGVGTGSFDDAFVGLCSAALLLTLGWAWAVTTVTVVRLVSGRAASTRGGVVRGLVLVACGVAVVGSGGQAHAEGGTASGLHGLPYPDRPAAATSSAPAPEARMPAAADMPITSVVVRAGDSLWRIAARTAAPGEPVDARWRGLLAANRAQLGDDPDLILPGQRIVLPRPRSGR